MRMWKLCNVYHMEDAIISFTSPSYEARKEIVQEQKQRKFETHCTSGKREQRFRRNAEDPGSS